MALAVPVLTVGGDGPVCQVWEGLGVISVKTFGYTEVFGTHSAISFHIAKSLHDHSPVCADRRTNAGHAVPRSPMRPLNGIAPGGTSAEPVAA